MNCLRLGRSLGKFNKNFNSKANLYLKSSNYFYRGKYISYSFSESSNPNDVKFNYLDDHDISGISQENIRNFCIIAHIDHGKSTLSDRILEECGVVTNVNKDNQQILDTLKVERERGITIKAQTASMIYWYKNSKYLLNLIDTPGHVDFTFEVIRSLKPCQGTILVVDATKGVQAQTVANYNYAKNLNLKILPVINKVDLPAAEIKDAEEQIIENFPDEFNDLGGDDSTWRNKILKISAKSGLGIPKLMESIITLLPPPVGDPNKRFRGLLYDAKFVETKGVILYIEVLDGCIKRGDTILSYISDKIYDIFEVGIVQPNMTKLSELKTGQVGYIITNMKEIKEAKIGDTLFDHKILKQNIVAVDQYVEAKSMVFSGIYPTDPSDYADLKKCIEKMQLTDSSLKIENEVSLALGAGFRIGFLGLLHLDVFHQRIEEEYDIEIIATTPSTPYKVKVKDNVKNIEVTYPNVKIENKNEYNKTRMLSVENVLSCPEREAIQHIEEPYIEAEIITPKEFYNSITNLVLNKRGEEIAMEEQGNSLIKAIFEIPLNEVIIDFYDKLKSLSQGYASFDYKMSSYRKSDIKICSFMIHGEKIDALSFFAHESQADYLVRKTCKKLLKYMPQQLFAFAIQGKIENKIVCREDVKALRKNVTAKCYGGDMTRRMKLLDKQKKGKKKMRMLGTVSFSSETFYNLLKDNSDE